MQELLVIRATKGLRVTQATPGTTAREAPAGLGVMLVQPVTPALRVTRATRATPGTMVLAAPVGLEVVLA